VVGQNMTKYRVLFEFDKENYKSLIIDSEGSEQLYREISSQEKWFTHTDDKNALNVINLRNVTNITITEYKRQSAKFVGV